MISHDRKKKKVFDTIYLFILLNYISFYPVKVSIENIYLERNITPNTSMIKLYEIDVLKRWTIIY